MADYYLCGWGQVLHAVVPAGVRDKAGTKNVVFVQPTPRDELPNPLPTVTPKQKQALDRLKKEGKPLWTCTRSPDMTRRRHGGDQCGLVSKGLARKFVERMERSAVDRLAELP